MRSLFIPIAASVVVAISFASSAGAATLGSVQGDVLINQGTGFKPVKGGAELRVGDAVMLQPGAQAELNYIDGCKFPVQVGVVVHVGAQSPCAVRANAPKPYGSGVHDARDVREAPPITTGSIAAAGAGVGAGFGVIAGGALVAGSIVAIGVGLSRDRNRASSP